MRISTTDGKSREYKVQMRTFRVLARGNTENLGIRKEVDMQERAAARRAVSEKYHQDISLISVPAPFVLSGLEG